MAIFTFQPGVTYITNGAAVIQPADNPASQNFVLDMPGRTTHNPGVNASGNLDAKYRVHPSGWSGNA